MAYKPPIITSEAPTNVHAKYDKGPGEPYRCSYPTTQANEFAQNHPCKAQRHQWKHCVKRVHLRKAQKSQPKGEKDYVGHSQECPGNLKSGFCAPYRSPETAMTGGIPHRKNHEYPIAHHDHLRDRKVFDQHLGDPVLRCKGEH